MTRSRTKNCKAVSSNLLLRATQQPPMIAAPIEFTSIAFPVRALKIIVHDLQSGGESATMSAQGNTFEVESDDGVRNSFLNVVSV